MNSASFAFRKLHDKNGISTYYTKPSKVKQYDNANDVLKDYNKILDHLGKNKWIWIIDGDEFEIRYSLEMQTGMGLAKLITGEHGENLQEIRIVNPTLCVRLLLKMALPFLNDTTRSKVNILTDRYYSLLEFL